MGGCPGAGRCSQKIEFQKEFNFDRFHRFHGINSLYGFDRLHCLDCFHRVYCVHGLDRFNRVHCIHRIGWGSKCCGTV